MTGMIAQLLAWPTLGIALLVFGFAPGAVLRLIVLLYRHGNPRRLELLGELYAVPRIERPFWVAEQLEVALFEGLRDRLKAWRDKRTPRTPTADQPAMRQVPLLVPVNAVKIEIDTSRGRTAFQGRSEELDRIRRLLTDDETRNWRGRGWRGPQPEVPPKGDHDPSAGV